MLKSHPNQARGVLTGLLVNSFYSDRLECLNKRYIFNDVGCIAGIYTKLNLSSIRIPNMLRAVKAC